MIFKLIRALTSFKSEGEVTSLSETSQGEVEDNRKKWGDFWKKLMVINQNIVLWPLWSYGCTWGVKQMAMYARSWKDNLVLSFGASVIIYGEVLMNFNICQQNFMVI